jgi:hypothetical protein
MPLGVLETRIAEAVEVCPYVAQAVHAQLEVLGQLPKERRRAAWEIGWKFGNDAVRPLPDLDVIQEGIGGDQDPRGAKMSNELGKDTRHEQRVVSDVFVDRAFPLERICPMQEVSLREHFGNLFDASPARIADLVQAVHVDEIHEDSGQITNNLRIGPPELHGEISVGQFCQQMKERMRAG